MLAHGGDACDVILQQVAADLALDGAEALLEVVVGLLQEVGDGEVQVDAPSIAGYAWIVAAKQLVERQPRAPGLQIPQRHIKR